jgi:hypothetical protein
MNAARARIGSLATIASALILSGCADTPISPSRFLDEVPPHFTLLHRDNVSALLVGNGGQVVNLAMTDDLYQIYRDGPWTDEVVNELTRRIFHYVYDDVFDFLIVSFDPDDPRPDGPLGWHTSIRNDVRGLCWPRSDFSGIYHTPPRLRSVAMLWRHGSLRNGPSLHEIAHAWGASLTPTSDGHWGLSGVGGQLGGWVTGTLEELEPGLYKGYGPSGAPFHVIANGGNRVPYAPLELYMMGFLPSDSIGPVEFAVDGEVVDSMGGTFTASSIRFMDDEDRPLKCGPRTPSHLEAPREFGVLYVVLSAGALSKESLDSIAADVDEFARAGPDERNDVYNFWEATGGRATLRFGGLLESMF